MYLTSSNSVSSFYWLTLNSTLSISTTPRSVSNVVHKLYSGVYYGYWYDHIIISKINNHATELCVDHIDSSTLYRTEFAGEGGVETFHASSTHYWGSSYYYTYYVYLYSGKLESTAKNNINFESLRN